MHPRARFCQTSLSGAGGCRCALLRQPALGGCRIHAECLETGEDDTLQRLDIHLLAHGVRNDALSQQLRSVDLSTWRSEQVPGVPANHPGQEWPEETEVDAGACPSQVRPAESTVVHFISRELVQHGFELGRAELKAVLHEL